MEKKKSVFNFLIAKKEKKVTTATAQPLIKVMYACIISEKKKVG